MGGIVTIPIIPTEEERKDQESITKCVPPPMDVLSLSFPLGNRLQNGPIEEGDEGVEESQKKRDEEMRRLEIQLAKDYQKWDPEKRINHEDSMRIYQRYNDHPFQPSQPIHSIHSPRPSSHSRSSRSS